MTKDDEELRRAFRPVVCDCAYHCHTHTRPAAVRDNQILADPYSPDEDVRCPLAVRDKLGRQPGFVGVVGPRRGYLRDSFWDLSPYGEPEVITREENM